MILINNFYQEAWIRMWIWYKDDVDCPPPPARMAIPTITAEWADVYRKVPPPGQPTPMGVQPFLVDDSIPEDEEISWAVCRI